MLNIFGTATCLNTNFVTGKGSDINQLPLKEFHDSLGIDVCNALPVVFMLFQEPISLIHFAAKEKNHDGMLSKQ